MFVIKNIYDQTYLHKNNEVLLFKDQEEASFFLNSLANYAYQTIGRAQGFSPFLEMDITQTLSSYLPMPADFKLEEQEKRDCGFKYIWAEELRIR